MSERNQFSAEYILPLKWSDDGFADSLTEYFRWLSTRIDVTVIDGSPQQLFDEHCRQWSNFVRLAPPGSWPGPNGKVAGVVTGIRMARHDYAIVADDDVRYDEHSLSEVIGALRRADLVRPQNYFLHWPWHARWDNGRTLINRAIGSDYPGTFGLRLSDSLRSDGYSGEALFENLELIRTIRAGGGSEVRLDGVFVGRVPPSSRHFIGQRVRQAYDDFAQPGRLVAELCLLPIILLSARRPKLLLVLSAAAIALAEWGRRRAGGDRVFPGTGALWAPLWVAERALCVWLALGSRLRGGVKYNGARIALAAHTLASLRKQHPGTL
jgi:hypothetical protein